MLGIRYFHAVAIDLYVGSPTEFVGDFCIKLPPSTGVMPPHCCPHETTLADIDLTSWSQALDASEALGIRHALVIIPTFAAAKDCLALFRSSCPKQPKSLRRLTFVMTNKSCYNAVQQELFKVFPET